MTTESMNHLPFIEKVAANDVAELLRKEATYKGSWRRNGGSHAWQMIKRKIDRLLTMLAPPTESDVTNLLDTATAIEQKRKLPGSPQATADLIRKAISGEDIFALLDADRSGADGTLLAEVRDLRRYLMLVEARMLAENERRVQEHAPAPGVYVSHEVEKVHGKIFVPTHFSMDVDGASVGGYFLNGDGSDGCEQNGPHGEQCCGRTDASGKSPEAPAPVPVSDSSRHADRSHRWHRCGTWVDHRWKVVPVIRTDWLEGAPQDLKDRFVITGAHAIVDRSQYSEEDREKRFPMRYSQTVVKLEYEKLSNADKELYEPRTGVEHEWQLRQRFRADWGK